MSTAFPAAPAPARGAAGTRQEGLPAPLVPLSRPARLPPCCRLCSFASLPRLPSPHGSHCRSHPAHPRACWSKGAIAAAPESATEGQTDIPRGQRGGAYHRGARHIRGADLGGAPPRITAHQRPELAPGQAQALGHAAVAAKQAQRRIAALEEARGESAEERRRRRLRAQETRTP